MERELGISYPTVRSRVEALVRALGFGPRDGARPTTTPRRHHDAATAAAGTPCSQRQSILERLARHEITADEAAVAIRSLGRTDR